MFFPCPSDGGFDGVKGMAQDVPRSELMLEGFRETGPLRFWGAELDDEAAIIAL